MDKTILYIFKAKHLPIYKIGISNNVTSRLRTIKSFSPVPIIIFDVFRKLNNPHKIEKMLHSHYKKNHSHGEWFELSSSEAKGIIKIINKFNETVELKERTKIDYKKRYDKSYLEYIKLYYDKLNDYKVKGGRQRPTIAKEIGISEGQLGRLVCIYKKNPEDIEIMDRNNISINEMYQRTLI